MCVYLIDRSPAHSSYDETPDAAGSVVEVEAVAVPPLLLVVLPPPAAVESDVPLEAALLPVPVDPPLVAWEPVDVAGVELPVLVLVHVTAGAVVGEVVVLVVLVLDGAAVLEVIATHVVEPAVVPASVPAVEVVVSPGTVGPRFAPPPVWDLDEPWSLCLPAPPPAAASGTAGAFAGGVAVATPEADVTNTAAWSEPSPELMTDEPAAFAE
jgi:hypothetical protein